MKKKTLINFKKNKYMTSLGFTLVELLAVIVILSVIALITTPIVMNQIEKTRKAGFINSAKNVLDSADIYVSNNNKLDQNGTSVKQLEIKNKETVEGLVFQNKSSEYILKNFTNGSYCASGSRNDLVVRKGDCTNEENFYASLSLSIKDITTRKATIVATAFDDTGITGYAYCLEDCGKEENFKSSKNAEYTFDSLQYSKKYVISVRVMNKLDRVTEKTIEVVTENLPTATYNVSPSGWQVQKTVAVTYPNDYENYILIHAGSAKLNGTVLPIGERVKISGTSANVVFVTNGSMEAITSDGYNEASSSTLTISQVDSTPPEQVSVGIGAVTSKSIQVIANGVDKESAIAKYEFQVNNGAWIDNGTNNTYLFNNLTTGTYTYKVRITNQTGLTTTSEAKSQATTTLLVPTYTVSPSGWATSKTASITYQTGYTNQFKVLSGNASYNGNLVSNNTWITITGTTTSVLFHTNGTIEARSTDGVNTVTASTLTISQIDTVAPTVNGLSITSTVGGYNAVTTAINSNVTDNSGVGLQMYLSNTGYETGGTWETYRTSKGWNVGGSLNGGTRVVYITYKDQAGNKTNRTLNYGVYAECSSNVNTSYGGWGACSKTCGGGVHYQNVTITDRATGRTCNNYNQSQSCNTQSCEPSANVLTFNNTFFETIVPLNNTTAIGLSSGEEYDNTRHQRFYKSYTDAFVIRYINGQISIGGKQRILSGANGSGYSSNVRKSNAARLSDNQFLVMGSSSTLTGSSDSFYDSDLTASIVEFTGTSFVVRASTTCPNVSDNANRYFLGVACSGNTCYATTSKSTSSTRNRNEYFQLNISGNSISCFATDRSSSGSEDYYYGDIENKAGIVKLGYESTNNSSRKEYSIINLGSGNYALKESRRTSSSISSPIEASIGGVVSNTNEKYYSINLCRLGNNRLVAYNRKSNTDFTDLYFYEFNAQLQRLELKYTKTIETSVGYSNKSVPFGDGSCFIKAGSNGAIIKW